MCRRGYWEVVENQVSSFFFFGAGCLLVFDPLVPVFVPEYLRRRALLSSIKGDVQEVLKVQVGRVSSGVRSIYTGKRGCVVVDIGNSSNTRYLFPFVRGIFSSSTLLFWLSYPSNRRRAFLSSIIGRCSTSVEGLGGSSFEWGNAEYAGHKTT